MTTTTDKQRQAQAEFAPRERELKGQRDRIIEHIEQFGFISPAAAWHRFGCSKLSTRIGEIEKRCGHEFVRTSVECFSRTGRRTRVRNYKFQKGLTAQDYKQLVHQGKRYEKLEVTL